MCETVPIYDARPYFQKGAPKAEFNLLDMRDTCPRLDTDFRLGDFVGIIHTISYVKSKDDCLYAFNILAGFIINSYFKPTKKD